MNKTKFFIISTVSLAICLSIVFTVFSFMNEIKRPQLPFLGQVRQFELVDSDGQSFSAQRLRDKVWIADFFFTTCGDTCPTMTQNMATLNRSFELVKDVALVSITVNPEQDSPEVLKAFEKRYKGKHGRWYFLTGEREDIRDVMIGSFKLGSIEEPIFHSSKFALVDRNGLIRGYYDGTNTEEVNELFKDTALLIKEK